MAARSNSRYEWRSNEMIIYGVAILAICLIVGKFIGEWLGVAIGVEANVGGVGIAMLLLIAVSHRFKLHLKEHANTALGISFWSAIYIPIIVAMAAKQNVIAAISGGPTAILAGVLAVIASLAMVPLISGHKTKSNDEVGQ